MQTRKLGNSGLEVPVRVTSGPPTPCMVCMPSVPPIWDSSAARVSSFPDSASRFSIGRNTPKIRKITSRKPEPRLTRSQNQGCSHMGVGGISKTVSGCKV